MVPVSDDSLVKKKSGKIEPYSRAKLERSLTHCGAGNGLSKRVLEKVEAKFKEGMTTAQIHKLTMDTLAKESKALAANYALKRAIIDLGPAGFHFEKLVAKILEAEGFDVEVGVVLPGRCVNHEVDVIARRKDKTYFVECKFHRSQGKKNDVKTALYIYARNLDLKEGPRGQEFDQFLLVSNTVFTQDAIQYSECVGLELLGINYPTPETLGTLIQVHALHPLTALRSLRKHEKAELLDSGYITCKDLWNNPEVVVKLLRSKTLANKVLGEVKKILDQ